MTNRTIRVLAIPGSLRQQSYNRSLARAASQLAPENMTISVYDALESVPVFNEDLEQPPPVGVAELRKTVAASDGLLLVTPEYNQSVPGVIKNTIDWLSRSEGPEGLEGKPAAVTGTTTGPWGTRLSQTQLRQILTSTQALVLPHPTLFLSHAETLFDEDQNLSDESAVQQLLALLAAFDQWIRLVAPAQPGEPDSQSIKEAR